MSDSSFVDYYKLLQVHYDASPEVIRAAYHKLSKTYHPDSAAADTSHMAKLNEAFAILSDSRQRMIYHREWLNYITGEEAMKEMYKSKGVASGEASVEAAKEALSLFFRYICVGEWESAYLMLTEEDRDKIPIEDFVSWREAIAECSTITGYDINFVKSYKDAHLEGNIFKNAIEFNVKINEVDKLSSVPSVNSAKKICVYDGASWRVWQGSNNIKSATLRYRMQAEKNKNIDPMALYKSAVNRLDSLTGLLSEEGFYDEFEKEIARTKRYNNPITIVAFKLRITNRERETAALCQLANIIRDSKRQTDFAARLNNNFIVCLLTETRKYGGELAARKFKQNIDTRRIESFTVSTGVVSYLPGSDPKTTVEEACRIAVEKP